jgi:hypothetical protein
MGADIAGDTRIGVVPPCAADPGAAFQNDQVGDSGPEQGPRCPETGEPGADDGHAHVGGQGGRRHEGPLGA